MPPNHASAVIRWRDQLDELGDGLEAFDQSATVSTMLFGCNSWLTHHAGTATPDEVARMKRIKAELETWMSVRGLSYTL
jgi:hypothetical protein